jgi:protein-tyrosine phosphatase
MTEITPPMALVVNSGCVNDQCPTHPGFYGPDIEVLQVFLLDDPKEGESHTCAGDSHEHYKLVNSKIGAAIGSGKSVLVHCMASLSRSVVLIIAYLMESRSLSALDATKMVKQIWDPTWPNDRFVLDLIKFEGELQHGK